MKKSILVISAALLATSAFADINGNGYYRVKNYGSQRWASLIDNKGSVNMVTGTADLHALELNNDTEEILSDPASIVYLTNVKSNQYNVAAQGTSLKELVGHEIFIGANGTGTNGQKIYRIWGKQSGATRYISDADYNNKHQYGQASIIDPPIAIYKDWEFIPVDVTTDNYFGAVPSVTADNSLYTSLYTSFGYKPYSEGVKAYYIGRVGEGKVEMIEIEGDVPGGFPVIIECASQVVSANRLQLVSTNATISGNSLNGVYFNYSEGSTVNHVAYDPATMRVLGRCEDGSLGFITANINYIPANSAYLKVSAGASKELKCLSPEDYDSYDAGVDSLIATDSVELKYIGSQIIGEHGIEISLYNLAGQKIASSIEGSLNVSNLTQGVYIAKSGNNSIKIVR